MQLQLVLQRRFTVLGDIQLELLDDVSTFVTVGALDPELSPSHLCKLPHHNYSYFNVIKPILFSLIILKRKHSLELDNKVLRYSCNKLLSCYRVESRLTTEQLFTEVT